MSGFAFSGFGSNNNNSQQQQPSGFGGFGSNNNPGGGFGQTPNTGFGNNNNSSTGGGLFGSNSGGFGSGGAGFGSNTQPNQANQPSVFGAGKGFGGTSTSGGGLFGNSTATAGSSSGFGGFGANSTTANTSSPFGGAATGGGLFGNTASKPAFGTGGSSGGLFGAGGFGTTNAQPTGAFGAPASTALSSVNPQTDGTGSTPFQQFTDKEPGGAHTNHFQSISFMQPYQKFSFEELRLADYAQGRRYGNGSGQAGAFGTSTGFGGFGQNTTGGFGSTGSTGGGLFGAGSSNNTSSPFGAAQTTNTGFGNNSGTTGGGLFGAKPAGGGLFGATTTTSSQPSGGLFGTTGSTGFGAGTGTAFGSGSTGGGLFGSNNGSQANNTGFKLGAPATGGFGQSSTGAFGQSNSTSSGGLFGNATSTASPFGGGQQQPAAANPFGGFGQTQNQASTATPFGGFGNSQSQQKPGGLFGNTGTTNTGGGLFGSNANNQQQTSGGLFGNTGNNQQTGGGLFGNKPATSGTGGGLFGNLGTNNTSNTSGSLFSGLGNQQQNQPNQGGGLFGNNQQQDKPGGLFGQTTGTTNNTGGGLFGNLPSSTNNQPSGGSSLFGNLGNNSQDPQQASGGQFGNNSSSILGNSQQNQQQGLLASLTDQNPYGHQSIFSGLPPPSPQNVGPIATPLSTGQKMKKSAILPQYKINPNAASRLVTPQKRGYGFTYSTYGSPSSISSAASTPGGLSSSLLGGSLGRSLGKSLSTSNLRRTFDSDSESILAPGAFSANSVRYSNTGSLKKLTIDRNVRTDLFGSQPLPALPSPEKNDQSRQAGILKKKVSFDSSTVGGNGNGSGRLTGNDQSNGALTTTQGESATPSADEQGFLRSFSQTNGNVFKANGAIPRPEMEQVKGNELAIVHEDGTPEHAKSSDARASREESSEADPEPGEYYMKPSREELRKMPREELKHLSGFIIGRQGCGYVRFDEPVDLTTLDLDDLYEKIAKITTRSITVYPVNTAKPPRGKGLNVPATLTLENCWPRSLDKKHRSHETSGSRFDLHVRRLKGVKNTNFVRYDKERGEWIFTVPHFTTYQLDYSDEPSNVEDSILSGPPYTPTPVSRTSRGAFPQVTKSGPSSYPVAGESLQSNVGREGQAPNKSGTTLPGAYDDEVPFNEDVAMDDADDGDDLNDSTFSAGPRSFHRSQETDSEGSVESHSENAMNKNHDQPVTGPFPTSTLAESPGGGDLLLFNSLAGTKSALKGSRRQSRNRFGTPFKAKFDIENDWAEQLQRTVSPRKQNRQALRERQATILKEHDEHHDTTPAQNLPTNGAIGGFTTSIDLMKSIFGRRVGATKGGDGAKQEARVKMFEWPYNKKPKTFDRDPSEMDERDQAFHESQKPSWGPDGTLIYAMAGEGAPLTGDTSTRTSGSILERKDVLVSEGKDICFVKYTTTPDLTPETLARQQKSTSITIVEGVPYAEMSATSFDEFSQLVKNEDQRSSYEKLVWELAHILFDDYDDDISGDVPKEERLHLGHQIRKERLSNLWRRIVQDSSGNAASSATTAEERAIAHLSGNNIEDACDDLLHGKDFRLATLVAQIGGDKIMREDMGNQINEWRRLNVLSEFTEPIRALYELLAGNTCVCEGKKGPVEDRARTFVMSERFGLDWRRAFGLRLWYAIDPDDGLEEAVHKFIQDMESGNEDKKPLPWFVEQGLDALWMDEHAAERVDLLWGLLKLFADHACHAPVNFADIVMPQNVSRNPTDTRLSFQLYHALSSSIRIRERTADQEDIDHGRADQLAWGFINQLEAAGEWLWAIFAALHLSSHSQRQKTLQSLLAHHADQIGQSSSVPFITLRDHFRIPDAWIWEAKALYARAAEQDHVREVQYLLQAKNWTEAHRTLCRTVAPRAIVERDYRTLSSLLDGFERKDLVKEWSLGGQVFQDFIALVRGEGGGGGGALRRLLAALPAMVSERAGAIDFVEMVAVKEMSGVVGRKVLDGKRNQAADGAKVLQLPLTEDAYLKHTLDLSLQYYRAVMAGGS